jgi:hypothetical protein
LTAGRPICIIKVALGSENTDHLASKEVPMDGSRDKLWNPATGRFDPVRVRREMMVRGWTILDLAREAGISRTSAYKVARGDGVLDQTALKVHLAFQRCPPVLDID